LTHLFSSPRLSASARYLFWVAATPRWVNPRDPWSVWVFPPYWPS
jgi:hypothetical protein